MNHCDGRTGHEMAADPLKVIPRIRRHHPSRGALIPVTFLAASLFLAGCAGAPTTERGTTTEEGAVAVEGPGTSASTESSEPGADNGGPGSADQSHAGSGAEDSGTSAPEPTAGSLSGSFVNVSEACKAISAQMVSIAFAPLSYSYGGGRAEAKEAVSKLSELREKVPSGLRDDFTNVERVFAESGHGYADFDEAAFRDAALPIEEWVTENCPEQ